MTMSGLHHWNDLIYVSSSVAMIMLCLRLCYDLWFTEVCASGYQDQCGIMRLFHDYLEMGAEIALCTITMLHWTRFLQQWLVLFMTVVAYLF